MRTTTATSRLARLLTWFHRGTGPSVIAEQPQISWRKVTPVAVLGILVAAIALADRVGFPTETDLNVPFTVGESWGLTEAIAEHGASVDPTGGTYGYDGQWYLGLAYDPLLRSDLATTFDRPQYRAQRPLFPLAGWLLAGGRTTAIPVALLLVNLLAVGLGCAACARIVTAFGRSRWWGMTFAVIPGVLVGVLFATAEPFGLALAALGLSLVLRRDYWWAGAAFAGAGLTKETYLAFAAAAAIYLAIDVYVRKAEWVRPAIAVVIPGAITFIAWWLYVAAALPAGQRTPNQLFTVPFHGWGEVFGRIARGEFRPDYPIGWGGGAILIATFLLLVAATGVALWRRRSLLAYSTFVWGPYALMLIGVLLGRFLSAQRALAPAVLAAALLLITVGGPLPAARVR